MSCAILLNFLYKSDFCDIFFLYFPFSLQPDPTANLTFNLSLTNRQKEDRSALVLPYTQAQRRDGAGLSSGQLLAPGSGGGKIFYQPDDADDFDDDDPDDDLDF